MVRELVELFEDGFLMGGLLRGVGELVWDGETDTPVFGSVPENVAAGCCGAITCGFEGWVKVL
jgi:hypothetical protein